MSELEMECVEEELEPWQKSFPHIHLPQHEDEDDDDEPIFVGVVSEVQREEDHKAMDTNDKSEEKTTVIPVNPPSSTFTPTNAPSSAAPSPMLPVSVVGTPGNAPHPIIVNNQGFIVTPQMTNNSNFFTSLGTPGTSFTFVSAQPQIFQHISQTPLVHSVVHRPQAEPVSDIMTFSNIQGSAIFNNKPVQAQVMQVNAVLPTIRAVNSSAAPVNGLSKHICTHCRRICLDENVLKRHIRGCKARVFQEAVALVSQQSGDGKRIMLVGEFYYGKFEGDGYTQETERTTTFKCHSCLKVLKNNIRFMNHMKHHLELEKQNSESFESHTTCQHCYRQYLTPFQLQCHIESAHSSVDSTTNCKICELAFESEQVLLDHMKNNHKPGEMPYVCQVCNFRSSFFSDVESHFRDAHANTKDLLCPFCLKVVKSGHIYMQHYMKHQKKGIFRCGKCRLNFLSFKEKVEHRTQVHKTFKKPEALEGLPPGTKVTIRASLAGKSSLPQSPQASAGLIVSANYQNDNDPAPTKFPPQKLHPENSRPGKLNVSQKKQKRTSKHNLVLKNLRPGEKHFTCIECNSAVLDFFSHFPVLLSCASCKYKTNCKKSIGNHMIRFHSTISKSRFSKESGKSSSVKLTLLCIKCDLLDASGGNRMIKHLSKRPNHICKVIKDRDPKTIEQVLTIEDLQPTSSETPNFQDERDSITNLTDAEEPSPAQTQTLTKNNTTDCEQDSGSSEIIMNDSPEVPPPEELPTEELPPEEPLLESSCVNSAELSEGGEVRTNSET